MLVGLDHIQSYHDSRQWIPLFFPHSQIESLLDGLGLGSLDGDVARDGGVGRIVIFGMLSHIGLIGLIVRPTTETDDPYSFRLSPT